VVTLVASYAALNKAGDARRAAALRPSDPDVGLALAWAELVALGGDRARGAELAAGLSSDTPARAAMAAALRAIPAAHGGGAEPASSRMRSRGYSGVSSSKSGRALAPAGSMPLTASRRASTR